MKFKLKIQNANWIKIQISWKYQFWAVFVGKYPPSKRDGLLKLGFHLCRLSTARRWCCCCPVRYSEPLLDTPSPQYEVPFPAFGWGFFLWMLGYNWTKWPNKLLILHGFLMVDTWWTWVVSIILGWIMTDQTDVFFAFKRQYIFFKKIVTPKLAICCFRFFFAGNCLV